MLVFAAEVSDGEGVMGCGGCALVEGGVGIGLGEMKAEVGRSCGKVWLRNVEWLIEDEGCALKGVERLVDGADSEA
jgi:hypothetical protein